MESNETHIPTFSPSPLPKGEGSGEGLEPLLLLGGGGHCKSVIEVAESIGRPILGILDVPSEVGKRILGYPVIGTDDDIPRYVRQAEFLVTVGHIKDPDLRIRLHERVEAAGGRLATLVASTARVSRHARLGEGTVVMHHCLVNASAEVGKGCILNSFCNIEHDAVIGDYTHISTGAMINGACRVGRGVFIGSQSVMANGTEVCDGCVVGAGALVRKSFRVPGIYSGNPAILKIKYNS